MSSDAFCGKNLAGPMVMVALFANLAIASLACSAEPAGGFLGRPLVEVEQQDFFKGFRLAEFAKRDSLQYQGRHFQTRPNSHSLRGRGNNR